MAFTHTHTQPRVLALFFSFFSEIKNRKRLKILFIFRRIDDFLFLISGKKKKKTTKDEKNLLNGGGKKKKKKKGHREKTMAISYFSSPSLFFSQMFCLSFFFSSFSCKIFLAFFSPPSLFLFFFSFSLSGINVADNGEPREVSVSAAGAFLIYIYPKLQLFFCFFLFSIFFLTPALCNN